MLDGAQQTIHELFNLRVGDPDLVSRFNLFSSSVTQKLWSTERYCEELLKLDIDSFTIQPSESDTKVYVSILSDTQPVNVELYSLHLNRLLDGFFMNSMSTLDTLAHQISTLYAVDNLPSKIYIRDFRDMLFPVHANSELFKLLSARLEQDWFTQLLPYRNCTTHESLIMHEINYSYNQVTRKYGTETIMLPDDPRLIPSTHKEKRAVTEYCPAILAEIQSLVDEAYISILADIHRAKDVLPIPAP